MTKTITLLNGFIDVSDGGEYIEVANGTGGRISTYLPTESSEAVADSIKTRTPRFVTTPYCRKIWTGSMRFTVTDTAARTPLREISVDMTPAAYAELYTALAPASAPPAPRPTFAPIPSDFTGHAADLHAAASAISTGMIWRTTPEGREFWSAIYYRLQELADAAEANAKPKLRSPVDYASACPEGYSTLAMIARAAEKPDAATMSAGAEVSRKARRDRIPTVWVEAPLVVLESGVTDRVRAYPTEWLRRNFTV